MIHSSQVESSRIQALNTAALKSTGFVLLWVQASVRVTDNHALAFAIHQANHLKVPIKAIFALTPTFPEANARHYQFLIEGLKDLQVNLAALGIPLSLQLGQPPEVVLKAAKDACLIVTDVGYLRIQRLWRQQLAQHLETIQLNIPLIQVESEAVIPVQVVSQKQEFAARTIRPKIHRLWHDYLVPLLMPQPKYIDNNWDLGIDVSSPNLVVQSLPIDQSVDAGREIGGETQALAVLKEFINHKLTHYTQRRNDPAQEGSSHLSAYLHYGQLSPLTAALAVKTQEGQNTDVFLEELIVRRELSFNFCFYQPNYDQYEGLPVWARQTLAEHAGNRREYQYSSNDLELAQTHDPYWNAAQKEMLGTGRMHNYMRMYWGKKILEWTASPQDAHKLMLWLNNRYQQDGRDANSFVGVGWVLGLHDRPWARRPIFGTVRYMNSGGLKRKFDIETYAKRWK